MYCPMRGLGGDVFSVGGWGLVFELFKDLGESTYGEEAGEGGDFFEGVRGLHELFCGFDAFGVNVVGEGGASFFGEERVEAASAHGAE